MGIKICWSGWAGIAGEGFLSGPAPQMGTLLMELTYRPYFYVFLRIGPYGLPLLGPRSLGPIACVVGLAPKAKPPTQPCMELCGHGGSSMDPYGPCGPFIKYWYIVLASARRRSIVRKKGDGHVLTHSHTPSLSPLPRRWDCTIPSTPFPR